MKKEYKKINRFKIKGLGWVQLNPHLLSFGHKNLPKDVHFTISWNGEKDIDFHLTRNVFNKDDKPQVPILKFERKGIKEELEYLLLTMFFSILRKIEPEEIREFKTAQYLSFTELDSNAANFSVDEKLHHHFKSNLKKGVSRIEVKGDWMSKLETWVISDDMIAVVNENMIGFDKSIRNQVEGGIIVGPSMALYVIKIFDEWFEFRDNMKPQEILRNLIPLELFNRIQENIKIGIDFIQSAKSKNDTAHFKPIKLVRKK
ncbi:hypothetical protein [Maribacter litoralis]|uniref:hypothetical protein n=1 Tax=Maribacter litoralis TaxID=2059726 RepID=UPI003F5CE5B1